MTQNQVDQILRAIEGANTLQPNALIGMGLLLGLVIAVLFIILIRGVNQRGGQFGVATVELAKIVGNFQTSLDRIAGAIETGGLEQSRNTDAVAENTVWTKGLKGAVEGQTGAVQKMDGLLSAHDAYMHNAIEGVNAQLSTILQRIDGLPPQVASAMHPKIDAISEQVNELKAAVDKRATDEFPTVASQSPMEVMASREPEAALTSPEPAKPEEAT